MRLFLAPMEGVVDHTLRYLMSRIGGVDICVTEFIRVTDHVLPKRVFYRYCPELKTSSKTAFGTPVRVQLLGGKPDPVAANAAKVAELGACAVDLNFGCPAKTVNKSDGGACLLQTPERLYNIIKATREQVPADIPVTAKMRLGFNDKSLYLENALAAFEAGADEITVHARSKVDGYRPPAYWEMITDIRERVSIPVIANGEIWSVADYQRCKEVTGCEDFMIGRGLLSCPDLALQIKADAEGKEYTPMTWLEVCSILKEFFDTTTPLYPPHHTGNRLKQWLHYLQRQYPQAQTFFEEVKRLKDKDLIDRIFARYLEQSPASTENLTETDCALLNVAP